MNRHETKLLEVGCGTGANVWYLSREGFQIYGIDASQVATGKAKGRLKNEKLQAFLIGVDIAPLLYGADFFDAVIDSECLYTNSIDATALVLQEIRRVLSPKGYFFGQTFSSERQVGTECEQISRLEFTNVQAGPFAGRGFVRLIDYEGIKDLYKMFKIISIDKNMRTVVNGRFTISEWVVVSRKKN